MSEQRLAEFFIELAQHQGKTDVVREILTQKCTDIQSLYQLILSGHHSTLNRNALLQFLALQSPTAAKDLSSSVTPFLYLYSPTGQLSFSQFSQFVLAHHRDQLRKMYTPDTYELRYTLFLLFVKEIENCQREGEEVTKGGFGEAVRGLFQGSQVVTVGKIARFCRQAGWEVNGKKEELLWRRLGRICRQQNPNQITLKEFGSILTPQQKPTVSQAFISTPPRKPQLKSSEKSTTQKKTLKLQLEDLSREVKKKVNQITITQISTKKMLAFLISICRRDKQLNALKTDLFNSPFSLLKLFREFDTTASQFITAHQLQPYFGETSDTFAFLYGCEGIIRFSDFVRMIVPMNVTFQMVESLEEVSEEVWERTGKILRKMGEVEGMNIREIEKLAAEFRHKEKVELFRGALFQQGRLNQADVMKLFEQNTLIMSQIELMLLFRKYDRDCDGYITLEDFSPYFR